MLSKGSYGVIKFYKFIIWKVETGDSYSFQDAVECLHFIQEIHPANSVLTQRKSSYTVHPAFTS